MMTRSSFADLSDHDLLTRVQHAVQDQRDATVHLIALLMEVDARRLYLAQGCASLFTFCTEVLHLSEHAAYGRIAAARAARRFPMILERLVDGTLHLTAVGLLAPHLTPENHVEVLDAARHQSKRNIEQLVARLQPRPDVAAAVRKLPTSQPSSRSSERAVAASESAVVAPALPTVTMAPPRRTEVKPLAPERYKIQFTVDRETYEKLRQAQDLLRHTIPTGDPAAIFSKALTLLLEHLSKTKLAAADRPRQQAKPARGRHIPAAVKRAVWQRDRGYALTAVLATRCAFNDDLRSTADVDVCGETRRRTPRTR